LAAPKNPTSHIQILRTRPKIKNKNQYEQRSKIMNHTVERDRVEELCIELGIGGVRRGR
jgi:hypothetical protein